MLKLSPQAQARFRRQSADKHDYSFTSNCSEQKQFAQHNLRIGAIVEVGGKEKIMKHRSISLALAAAAIFFVSEANIQPVAAQDMGPPAARPRTTLRIACAMDMERLCQGLIKKEARQCLKAHRSQLSRGCKTYLQEAKMRRGQRGMSGPPEGSPGDSSAAPPPGGQSASPPPGGQRGGPRPGGADDDDD